MRPRPVSLRRDRGHVDGAGYRRSIDGAIWDSILHAPQLAAIAISEASADQQSSRLCAAIGDRLVVTTATEGVIKTQLVSKLKDIVSKALKSAFAGFPAKVNISLEENL